MRYWPLNFILWVCCLAPASWGVAQAPPPTGHARYDSLIQAGLYLQFPQDVVEMRLLSEATIIEAKRLDLTNELIRLYAERGKMYLDDAPLLDSCLWFLKKAESMLSQADYPEGETLTYLYQGWYYSVVSDSLRAMRNLDRAKQAMQPMEAAMEDSATTRMLGRFYLNLGSIYQAMNHYERAMSHYLHGLPLTQRIHDTITTTHYHVQIGELYRLLNQPDLARTEFEKVLSLTKNGVMPKRRAWAQEQLGELLLTQGNLPEALAHLKDALHCRRSILLPLGPIYLQLGRWHAQQGQADSARAYLTQVDTAELHYRFKTQYFIAWAQTQLAYGHLEHAQSYALQGEAYARQQLNKSLLQQVLVLLVQVLEAQQDWETAFRYQAELATWDRRLRDESQRRAIVEMEAKFDSERREQQIAALGQENAIKDLTLRQQRYQLWGLVVFIPLLVGFGLIINQRKQYRAQRRELDLERTLLRTQMNPHFIFNALASIQHAVLNKETQKATLYLAQFGEFTRSILESSRKVTISLADELEMAQNYFALEQIRFEKRLTLEVERAGVATGSIQVPAMILQPLLENAIKHAFAGKAQGHILIRLTAQEQTLSIQVIDDGVGLISTPTPTPAKQSLGLQILEERLRQHWQKPPSKLLTLAPHCPTGVCITLLLPLSSHD
ncbi:MAG TPA: hypothetical protein DCE41_05065 [Cytophagales bacterium]|nr:hypothetical protein [Cytophagales bacterium]